MTDAAQPPDERGEHDPRDDERFTRPPGWGRNYDGTGPGKQKGSTPKQRANYKLKYAIQCKGPDLINKLFKLSNNKDKHVAIGAIRLLLLYGWGRPTIHVEIDGTITKKYVAVMPPTMEHEEWMKMIQGRKGPTVVEPTSAASNGHPTASANGNGHLGS